MKQFLNEHGMLFKTCLMQNTNNRNRTDDTTKDLFHPEHGMFWISLTSLMASLLLMLFTGATYEAYKIKFQKNKTDVKEQKKKDISLADEIENVIGVWRNNKKENLALFY